MEELIVNDTGAEKQVVTEVGEVSLQEDISKKQEQEEAIPVMTEVKTVIDEKLQEEERKVVAMLISKQNSEQRELPETEKDIMQ